jgi:purine-binding chemotaxis protein CheW
MKTKPRPGRATSFDWQAVRRRVESLREVIEQGWTPSPSETNEILKARTRELADPLSETAAAGERRFELIEFALASERYGVDSSFVREVYPLTDLTPLPCTPRFVLGVINVRGEIVSVIDIKKFFDMPEKGLSDLNKVIILHSDAMTFGILADLIIGLRSIAASEIQPAPTGLTGIRDQYLMGVTHDRLVILDAVKLLMDQKIVVHETVEA